MVDLVTLAEAKAHLNIVGSTDDAELPIFITAATSIVERYVGAVLAQTLTERFDGGRRALILAGRPVTSVTSVIVDGAALAAGAYTIDKAAGIISSTGGRFAAGSQNVVIVYDAGRASVDPHHRLAALIIIQHMWETQRGTASPRQRDDTFDPRYTYSIPRRALELLGEPTPGVA